MFYAQHRAHTPYQRAAIFSPHCPPGLFGSVRPGADNAGRYEAPEFVVKPPGVGEGSGREKPLALVPPLGCIRFRTTPRSLPAVTSMNARVDSSLKVCWGARWGGEGGGVVGAGSTSLA